jgi:hypothetical protein
MPDPQKSSFDRFLRPILASRFITISALIHLLLVFLVGGRVLFDRYVEPPDFQSTGDSTVATDTDSEPPPPTPEANLPPTSTQNSSSAPPPMPAPALMAMSTMNPTATSFSVPMPVIAPPTIGKELTQATSELGTATNVTLPGAMSGRPGGSGGNGTGEKYGEKPAAEESVLRALRWLQSQQQTDGTWSDGQLKGGFTGLALLCFLGHGETPGHSAEFSVVVTNAINAIVAEGAKSQGNLSFTGSFAVKPAVYDHAIATYALCEAYAMTKDPALEPAVRQAVNIIVKGQRSNGGWGYYYDTSRDDAKSKNPEQSHKSDSSVTGWQLQALKAAHLTGLSGMENLVHPAMVKGVNYLDTLFDPKDGTYAYRVIGDNFDRHGNRFRDLTGVGVLAKLFLLGRVDRDVRAGLKSIMSSDLSYLSPQCSFYGWYYDTQACFQAQGSAWQWWNARFQDLLISQQGGDGSWPPSGGKEPVAIANSPGGDGPVYRTTLCCLMLEVFYRYLPTTDQDAMGSSSVDGL